MEKDVFLIKEISKDWKISMDSIRKVSEYLDIEYFKNGKNFSINHDSYLQLEEFYKTHLTLEKLCKKYNISIFWIEHHLRDNKLKFKPLMLGKFHFYDKENEDILKEHLKNYEYRAIDKNKLTKFTMSKYLKVSRNKLNNYLQYFKPNSEEFDGKYYTYEFANKMKKFMDEYPSIRQNKVYVKELNDMEFDSRAEAYYYCYMKDHNHKIKHHPLNLYFIDSKGNERRYEVDFLVDGELVEIKGDNQFDENGKPFFRGKSWQEKYDCMIKNNVKIITSNKFEKNNEFNFMKKYFKENYSFVKSVKELFIKISEEDKHYLQSIKLNLARNSYIYKCIETSEIHFAFEWEKILGYGVSTKICSLGRHFTHANDSEHNSYILSKIEELRSKGLDVSWFDKNKEKYLKTENEKETIVDL